MLPITSRRFLVTVATLFSATGFAVGGEKKTAADAVAMVPSFERVHGKGNDPINGGRLLLAELSCINCHAPAAGLVPYLTQRQAPILDGVGQRIRHGYLKKFISDPEAVKPGTTMPRLFAGMTEQEKEPLVEALVQFLASTGTLPQEKFDRKSITAGKDLYAKVGCVVCHGPRNAVGEAVPGPGHFVSLGDLKAKYSLTSLRTFLADPLHSRPSARMPGLLDAKGAKEVANYLLQGLSATSFAPSVKYGYYEGAWAKVPEFKKLKPTEAGEVYGVDVSLARRGNDFAMSFDSFLRIDQVGEYRFHLHSDDGSNLFVDDKLVVDNDGVHAPAERSGAARMTAGMHPFHVGFFQGGGGFELRVDIEGPGLPRQEVTPYLYLTAQGNPAKSKEAPKADAFTLKPELVAKGKELFTSLGCANCHSLSLAKRPLVSTAKYPGLDKLAVPGGCLDKAPKKGVPHYALNANQRDALSAALKTSVPTSPPSAKERLAHTLTTFNCYACHQRDKIGGPTEEQQPYFTGTQQDLADEGRLPPSLNGVGAKINLPYLKDILDKGSHDRTYMNTQMPRFAEANVGHLATLFTELDKLETVPDVTYSQPIPKVKAQGRHMVGAQALGCIKCHTFNGNKAEGVQGMDMTIMTARLKRDWFHQYLLNPSKFRPGTRMPTAWPEGQSLLPKILGGDTPKQIEAVWLYLADAKKALLPVGMNKNLILLNPDNEAIIFRNFLSGSGPRSIGVGYPEQAHLSFDANDLRLATLWQGAFMDAGRHWTNRGEGFQPPLGDNIMNLPPGVSFASLAKDSDPWPTKSARELGNYHFLGYRLAKDQRPTFMYSIGDVKVDDFPNPMRTKTGVSMMRTLTLTSDKAPSDLYFRAAVAAKIEALGEGWYKIGDWKMRLEAAAAPKIRPGVGNMELLVPIEFKDGKARVVQEYVW
jgi:mono/diheme cytochrome c family protein